MFNMNHLSLYFPLSIEDAFEEDAFDGPCYLRHALRPAGTIYALAYGPQAVRQHLNYRREKLEGILGESNQERK